MSDRFVSINVSTFEDTRGEDMTISVDQAIETFPEVAQFLRRQDLREFSMLCEGFAIDIRWIDPDQSTIWESVMPGVWRVSKNELAPS